MARWQTSNDPKQEVTVSSSRNLGLLTIVSMVALIGAAPPRTLAQTASVLAGIVSSNAEPRMEGVIVTAKREGSTVSVSVVSDANGEYQFPAGRLVEGRYALTIRAAGYDLDHPEIVELTGDATAADLHLKPTQHAADQLTNAEWLASAPGTDDIKRQLLNCTDCHSLQRIFKSQHTQDEFLQVFERMGGYYPGATDLQPQRLVGAHRRPPLPAAVQEEVAAYLASVNLSTSPQWPFEPKTFPRPSGRATRVIVTEYDLPRKEIQPHDVVVDRDGIVWFSNFGEQFLSKLDPRTGEVTNFAIPIQKPGFPTGTLDLELDEEGNLWIGLMYQTGVAKFDRSTETFQIYPLPLDWQKDGTQQSHLSVAATKVDGKAWVKNSDGSQVMRLDLAHGDYENLGTYRDPRNNRAIGIYGIYADQQNNAYILEFPSGGIGKIDAKTTRLSFYPIPSANARARRGRVDSQNRLWFAEFGADAVGMFDPETEKITEWKLPLPWEAPYDAVADKNGNVWEVNETSDRVGRLDPRTGQITDYLLPRYGNIRRVFVDDRTSPVTIWIGNNLAASIIKMEPLD
jgi:virginiamycin B lyase